MNRTKMKVNIVGQVFSRTNGTVLNFVFRKLKVFKVSGEILNLVLQKVIHMALDQ